MELTPSVTPDAAGLKALAHPVRLRMLGMLRIDGPATATSLAARLGLNSGATSYHLRQLADHGFIVDDQERGNGRERWWRAAHASTRTSSDSLGGPDDEDPRPRRATRAVAILLHRAAPGRRRRGGSCRMSGGRPPPSATGRSGSRPPGPAALLEACRR